MYIIMPNKLPNIRNAYKYPNNTKENYNIIVNAIKLLGLEAAAPYIQSHTPPIPIPSRPKSASNSRASIAKKARPAVGTWRVKGKNGITTGENFRKSDGTPYTVINQKGLNLKKVLNESIPGRSYERQQQVQCHEIAATVFRMTSGSLLCSD